MGRICGRHAKARGRRREEAPMTGTLKRILVWLGIRFLNSRLKLGVRFIGWMFSISHTLRAA